MYIGMTERGDAGLDLTWYDKIINSTACVGAILITKGVANIPFQEKALALIKEKPAIIHAGITGWGGSPMEPNIKTPNESINGIRKLIDDGFPAENIVIRIDPIFPTEEGLRRAALVVGLAKRIVPEVKRIRISIYDDYHTAREEMIRRGYQPIDHITKWKSETERRPTEKQVKLVAETLLSVARPDQIFELCAEPELADAYPDRFKWFGCLSQKDCDIMGIAVPEGTGINGQNRYGCRCLMLKHELLTNRERCPHNCAYCYWGKSSNS